MVRRQRCNVGVNASRVRAEEVFTPRRLRSRSVYGQLVYDSQPNVVGATPQFGNGLDGGEAPRNK